MVVGLNGERAYRRNWPEPVLVSTAAAAFIETIQMLAGKTKEKSAEKSVGTWRQRRRRRNI